jgi:hypothetical protein
MIKATGNKIKAHRSLHERPAGRRAGSGNPVSCSLYPPLWPEDDYKTKFTLEELKIYALFID